MDTVGQLLMFHSTINAMSLLKSKKIALNIIYDSAEYALNLSSDNLYAIKV